MKVSQEIKLGMLGFVFGTVLTFVWIFTTAYLSVTKTTMVDINSIGEANLEMFILIPISVVSCIYLIYDEFRK